MLQDMATYAEWNFNEPTNRPNVFFLCTNPSPFMHLSNRYLDADSIRLPPGNSLDSMWSLEVAVVLDPLVPLHAVPIDQSIAFELGPFGVKDVPTLTARVLDSPLFRLVETVKSW